MKNSILLLFSIIALQISAQNLDSTNLRTRSWAIFTDLGINSLSEFNLGFEYFIKKNRSLEFKTAYRYLHGLLYCTPYIMHRRGTHLDIRYNFYKSSKRWDWTISPGIYLGYHYLRNFKVDCSGYGAVFYLYEDVFTLGAMYRMSFNYKKLPGLALYFNIGFRGGVNSSEWRHHLQEARHNERVVAPIFDFGIRCQFVKFKKMKNNRG